MNPPTIPGPRRGLTDTSTLLDRYARARDVAPDPNYDPDAPPAPEEAIADNRARALHCIEVWAPSMFHHARADHPDVTAWADRYIADRDTAGSLILLGKTGSGKTHQAYGAIRRIAESGRPPIAWRSIGAADLYAQLRGRSGDEAQEIFDHYARLDLLLLDDLGACRDTPFTEEITYRLVNHRYQNNLPLIITSNLPPKALSEGVGERTASRLVGMATKVVISGDDRRRAR